MPTRNINLTDRLDRFIAKEVKSGHYGNASEVVRESPRLLQLRKQEEQAKLKWLREAVQSGIDSIERGEGIEFASWDQLEAHIDGVWEEARIGRADRRKRA